jgi:hypothetical protein
MILIPFLFLFNPYTVRYISFLHAMLLLDHVLRDSPHCHTLSALKPLLLSFT